jgi:hypothetical protein
MTIQNQERGFFERVFGIFDPRPKEDIVTQILDSPEIVPRIYLPGLAITASLEYERLRVAERVEDAAYHLKIARRLTDYIYKNMNRSKTIVFPQHYMDEEATESGALGLIIDPDKEYPADMSRHLVLVKEVDELRGRQAFRDSQHFQNDLEFKLEHILANIPLDEETSYLWKQFIVGPNLSDLFQTLDDGILSGSEEEQRLLSQLEAGLSDIAAKRVLYWQENAPDLIDIPRDPARVIEGYKRSFMKILNGFSEFTDIDYSEEERFAVIEALDKVNWEFINRNTVVRNVAATYRNMVISTGKINIDYPKFIELFTEGGGKARINRWALEERLYFVDTPNKYSHILEDPWEMDLFSVGQAKKSAVKHTVQKYKEDGLQLTQLERLLVGTYRAYRKAYLILSKFGPSSFEKFETGLIDKEEYERKQFKYRGNINYLLERGQQFLSLISRYVPADERENFNILASALQKLGTYTTIDYKKSNPS